MTTTTTTTLPETDRQQEIRRDVEDMQRHIDEVREELDAARDALNDALKPHNERIRSISDRLSQLHETEKKLRDEFWAENVNREPDIGIGDVVVVGDEQVVVIDLWTGYGYLFVRSLDDPTKSGTISADEVTRDRSGWPTLPLPPQLAGEFDDDIPF